MQTFIGINKKMAESGIKSRNRANIPSLAKGRILRDGETKQGTPSRRASPSPDTLRTPTCYGARAEYQVLVRNHLAS
jgi:hypothetical protein